MVTLFEVQRDDDLGYRRPIDADVDALSTKRAADVVEDEQMPARAERLAGVGRLPMLDRAAGDTKRTGANQIFGIEEQAARAFFVKHARAPQHLDGEALIADIRVGQPGEWAGCPHHLAQAGRATAVQAALRIVHLPGHAGGWAHIVRDPTDAINAHFCQVFAGILQSFVALKPDACLTLTVHRPLFTAQEASP